MLYLIFILILLIDQVTKYYAVKLLKNAEPFIIIDNFLQFNYVENFGAAFGILRNQKMFFIIVTSIVILGIIIYMIKNKKLGLWMRTGLIMIISGAIGNFIDRVRLGYVIDFIDVKFGTFYDYPVFNIADSAIVIGTILISYLILTDKHETIKEE